MVTRPTPDNADAGDVASCVECGSPIAAAELRCFWCGALRWRPPIAGTGALRAVLSRLLPADWRRPRGGGET